MSATINDQNKSIIKEMLFADYQYLQEAFWKNETIGETRLNFFITLFTAVIAALVTLITTYINEKTSIQMVPEFIFYVVLLALFILFGTGIITLARLLKRNEATDGYKKDMDRIRNLIKEKFDDGGLLSEYHLFAPDKKAKTVIRTFGGLKDLMIFFNSLVITLLIADIGFLINHEITLQSVLILCLLAFPCSWAIHILLIKFRSSKAAFILITSSKN